MKFLRNASIALLSTSILVGSAVPAFAAGVTTQIKSGLNTAAGPSFSGTTTDLPTIIGLIINTLLTLVGVLLLAYLIYGGFRWMTAGGDTSKVKEARELIKNTIIGLVIIFSAYAIANFVLDRLVQVSSGTSTEVDSSPPGNDPFNTPE